MIDDDKPIKKKIHCAMCGEKKKEIEEAGGKFVSCDPIPDEPGKCWLVYHPPV